MTAILAPPLRFRGVDNNGFALVNGLLSSFIAGTSTPQATYVDSTQTTQNTNPIQLDARGECNLWLDPTKVYKFSLTDQFGNPIWTQDQVQGSLTVAALYPQTAAEIAAGVTPSNYVYPSPGIESGDLRRYGGTAPNIPSVVFFDGSTSHALIGQGFSGTNIWFSNGTASSRLQEFASCFQYNATGGGAYADDNNFGVALYAAAQLTGGSRAVFGLNAVVLVSNTAGSGGTAGQLQAAAMAIETDTVNNSNTDANLNGPPYAYTAPDQMLGIRMGSTGNKRPQYAFATFSSTVANRWQGGGLIVNWQQFGLQIIQDPANQPATGAAVTGPCIQLWASSSGGNPIFQLVNVAGTEVFSITQAGEVINANNVPIQFRDSATVPQNAINVDASNNLRLSCSPTGPGNGFLLDHLGGVKFSWNATGFAFNSGAPVAQVTGYGTPTGGSHQASFSAGSITLPNLAAAVAQLIVDFKNYGLVGA